jgi:hypothetical protein
MYLIVYYEGKAIPVRGHGFGGTKRLARFIDSWLVDGGEVVSPTCQSVTLHKQEVCIMSGRIRSTEKFSDLIENQTHDLSACSIVL